MCNMTLRQNGSRCQSCFPLFTITVHQRLGVTYSSEQKANYYIILSYWVDQISHTGVWQPCSAMPIIIYMMMMMMIVFMFLTIVKRNFGTGGNCREIGSGELPSYLFFFFIYLGMGQLFILLV
jgi:hypothetical protein